MINLLKNEVKSFFNFYFREFPAKSTKRIISFGFNFAQRQFYSRKYDFYKWEYDIHPSFDLRKNGIEIIGEGEFRTGKGGHLGRRVLIKAVQGCVVSLGDYVRIGNDTKIYTSNNNPRKDLARPEEEIEQVRGNVEIEDGVWIGDNCFIKAGVTIGQNAVVGPGSVVTKDVESNVVAAGSPAEKIYKKKLRHPQ